MKEPTQGTGAHLPHGSITAEINRLRHQVEARNATIATLEARVRRLEGAISDVLQSTARLGRAVTERKVGS